MAEGNEFWYVIQTETGKEEQVKEYCEERMPMDAIRRIFIPRIECERRQRGEWVLVQRPLYPGYIFMVVDNPDAVFKEDTTTGTDTTDSLYVGLKQVPRMTKFIGTGRIAVPLSDEDVLRIRRLAGDGDVVELSVGIIEGDEIRITQGPLSGQEAMISKIDRHKRIAWVESEFMGQKRTIKLGLEIVAKSVVK